MSQVGHVEILNVFHNSESWDGQESSYRISFWDFILVDKDQVSLHILEMDLIGWVVYILKPYIKKCGNFPGWSAIDEVWIL